MIWEVAEQGGKAIRQISYCSKLVSLRLAGLLDAFEPLLGFCPASGDFAEVPSARHHESTRHDPHARVSLRQIEPSNSGRIRIGGCSEKYGQGQAGVFAG